MTNNPSTDDLVMRLRQAIERLEAQRGVLGDDTVNPAIESMQRQLAELNALPEKTESALPRLTACLVINLSAPVAETLPRLLAPALNLIAEIVRQYGGRIQKIRGVYLIALFNSAADDPIRAAHAALEIRQRLRDFSDEMESNGQGALLFRAGLNTGVITAQNGSLGGEAITIAGILSQRAPPGSVLVSQQTAAYLNTDFLLHPAAPIDIAQKQILTYLLIEARQSPPLRRQGPALEEVFIGRSEDVRIVLEQIEQLGTGKGGLMVITGEPGLGKSRLVSEVRRGASMPQWIEARCQATLSRLIFGAWNDILLNLTGSHPLEAGRVIGKRLQAWLDEHALPDLYPVLAGQLGITPPAGSPQQVMRQIVQTWQHILSVLASQRPTVIAFDEVQAIDSSSLALLESLIDSTRDLPILWIMTAQPLYNQPVGAVLSRLARRMGSDFIYLGLEPLDDEDTLLLLRNLLHVRELPDPFEEGMLQRAAGNPLMLIQTLQSIIDRRGLVRDVRGQWQVAVAALRDPTPTTLPEIVRARLGTLAKPEQEWLQLAAVGGDALLPGLAAALPAGPNRDALLTRLRDLGYLQFPGLADGFAPSERAQFINPALADAIRATTEDKQCQEYHRRIVGLLTKQGELSGSWQALVAYHMANGLQTQGALRVYSEAKAWAYANHALSEVSQMIEGMLGLLTERDSPEDVARLLTEQQDVLSQIDPSDPRCKALLERAYHLWLELGNAGEAAATMLRVAVHHAGTPYEQQCYQEAQTLLERENPQHEMLPSIYLQQALYLASQGYDSKEMFQRARTLALQLKDVRALAHIYFEMGLYQANSRQLEAALSSFGQAFSYFGQVTDGLSDQHIMTCNYLADLYTHMGKPGEGEYFAAEAIEDAHRGSDLVQVLPFITLSECYAAQARWQDAFTALAKAPAQLAPPDMPPRFWLGRWQFEHGDRLDGLEVMRDALPRQSLECLMIFVDYLLEANFTQEAELRIHQLSKDDRIKSGHSMWPAQAYYDRLRGRLAAAQKDYGRAISLLDRARWQFERDSFVLLNISTRRIYAGVLLERRQNSDEQNARALLLETATWFRDKDRKYTLHAESSRVQRMIDTFWPSGE